MGKKLIVVCAFAFVAILASYAASEAQFGGGGVAASDAGQTRGLDIENEVRNLYLHLHWEKNSQKPDSTLVAKHAELLAVLNRYMATERIAKAVAEFETIIKEMPDTPEARKAATAIGALKGEVPRPVRNPLQGPPTYDGPQLRRDDPVNEEDRR